MGLFRYCKSLVPARFRLILISTLLLPTSFGITQSTVKELNDINKLSIFQELTAERKWAETIALAKTKIKGSQLPLKNDLQFILGLSYFYSENWAKAIQELTRITPPYETLKDYIFYFVGRSHYESGNYAQAIKVLSEFNSEHDSSIWYKDAIGYLAKSYFEQKNYKKASHWLLKYSAFTNVPNKDEAIYQAALSLKRTKNNYKAFSLFRRIYIHYPNSDFLKDATTRLHTIGKVKKAKRRGMRLTLEDHLKHARQLIKYDRFKPALKELNFIKARIPKEYPSRKKIHRKTRKQ
jgi:TolA-binding protein